MSKIHAAVTAVHGYVPDYILTNQELETMVDTNDEWIRTRTGVEERRILKEPGKATSDMAVPAVKQICEKCKVIRGNGRVMVICENPRHKQRQG